MEFALLSAIVVLIFLCMAGSLNSYSGKKLL